MKVTYTNYPLLLFTSYDKESAPQDLPFEMPDNSTLAAVQKSQGFGMMFGYIAVKNTLEKKNSTINYFLTPSTFNSVEHNANFRNSNFQYFLSKYITPRRGCIMFHQGGTYVYNLLGVQETKNMYKVDGRYMSVAFFAGNMLIGFEECFITSKGPIVQPNGIYNGGMDVGGYLSFCIITLAYADGRSKVLNAPDVKETIFEL